MGVKLGCIQQLFPYATDWATIEIQPQARIKFTALSGLNWSHVHRFSIAKNIVVLFIGKMNVDCIRYCSSQVQFKAQLIYYYYALFKGLFNR